MTIQKLINDLAKIQALHGPDLDVHLQHADEKGGFLLELVDVRFEKGDSKPDKVILQ